MAHKFPYEWNMADGYPSPGIEYHGETVFSCFACGGGSSMGYKLAGYDVLGFNEIDPKMGECYIKNHKPKFSFVEKIQDFVKRETYPKELYDLAILDGSPPCSSFSAVGNREADWGKKKKFTEGQEEQVLDTLFFDFIALAKKLQPRVVVAENVEGILYESSKHYVKRIITDFEEAGYEIKIYRLNSKKMGVPQSRKRVFFIAVRKDISRAISKERTSLFSFYPALDLKFKEREIPFGEIENQNSKQHDITDHLKAVWSLRKEGDVGLCDIYERTENRRTHFSYNFVFNDKPVSTLVSRQKLILWDKPRFIDEVEYVRATTYPTDYDYCKSKPFYLCGMSVPPVMVAQIANRIYEQWLKKISNEKTKTLTTSNRGFANHKR